MRRYPKLLALAVLSTLTFAAPTSSADVVADVIRTADPCPAVDDDEVGMGGQEVSCAFTCGQLHQITVSVHADDEDANVAGEGTCSNVTVMCGEHDASCEKTSAARAEAAGAGTCAGRSEEVWDSGLRVNCWSVPPDQVDPDEPPVNCVVNPPIVGCIPACQPVGSLVLCVEPETEMNSAHVWSHEGVILGAVCTGSSCRAATPRCETDIRGHIVCRVGG